MISLAITTYNRSDLVVESFLSVLNNEYINEIVIVDDFSDESIFDDLKLKLDELQNNKIKLYRNDSNLKPLLNKLETIKYCQNEWVILLDSDNKITNDYIDVIKKLEKDEDVLYVSEKLLHFNNEVISDFFNIKNCFINNNNIKDFLNRPELTTVLNVGNFFVNKNKYLETFIDKVIEYELQTNDALYFSYLWIMANRTINVVDGLSYYHRQHDGSWYLNNSFECNKNTNELINRLSNI